MKKYLLPFLLLFLLLLLPLVLAQQTEGSSLKLPPGLIKLQEYQEELALSLTFLIAFIGGILTFTSPCGFVLIPTFFSYVFKERKRAMYMTAMFSLGMTLAFIIFGLIAGLIGNFFNLYKEFFASISGGILVLFGVMLIFNKGFGFINFKVNHQPKDGKGMFVFGFLFSVGWTPCVGPILGAVMLIAADTANMVMGATLFGFYSLGVSLPLLLVAYFSDRYDVSKWVTSKHVSFKFFGKKIHTHLYGIIGGILIILTGAIMFFQQGTRVFMRQIPQLIPWSMNFFVSTNSKLFKSTFFTGMWGNVLGVTFALIILFVMYRAIKDSNAYKEPPKRKQ